MMNKLNPVSIIGAGKYVPETVINNEDLAKIVDTSDEWISTRTGIKERRVVSGNETASDLATNAAKDALGYAGIDADEVDLIITATSTPDNLYPSTACEVQAAINAKNAAAFDLVAACSGFVYAISVARNFIQTGTYNNILVIGVDVHSRFVDWNDRSTCVLFGDGAGAVVLQKSKDDTNEILSMNLKADGARGTELKIPLNGKNCPVVEPNEQKDQFVYMNGKEIYKFAVSDVPASIKEALDEAGITNEELDFFVPHQANIRIINAMTDRLKLRPEQVIVNAQNYGNTSTASIPIALVEALEQGRIKPNSKIALCGYGAGLTWGSTVINWRAEDKRK